MTIRDGVAEGPLVGGCLETICRHLKDSQVWLDLRGVRRTRWSVTSRVLLSAVELVKAAPRFGMDIVVANLL